MPTPRYERLMLPLLQYLSDGKEHSLEECSSVLLEHFNLTKFRLSTSSLERFENKVKRAAASLIMAFLVTGSNKKFIKITERGTSILKQGLIEINEYLIYQLFVEFGKAQNNMMPRYSLSQCAEDTGFEEEELKRWIRAIERKGQAILYGSPGTGKSFIADKLAQLLIAEGDGFYELVQFHPAYSYEDFIQGIRPQAREDGGFDYKLIAGRFLEFCKQAELCEDPCVLIIDEINRANLAQVFGELMYLLEYRDRKIPLAGGNSFQIPNNVYIIGTMNTADRSIALVDHALRRRFAFIELRPNYEVLRRYHQKRNTGFPVDGLIRILEGLNQAIADKHYEIGISFFMTENLAEDIEDIWKMEIEPYLEEYFFDRPEKVEEFRWQKIENQVL